VGLQYFGKRYYAPLLNRWVSADPLTIHALGADPNAYAYVSGRALQAVDPMGLQETPEQQVQTALEQGMAQQQAGTGGGVCGENMSCAAPSWETGVANSSNLVNQTAPPPARAQSKPAGGSLGVRGPVGAAATAAGNAGVGAAAFLAGVGDMLTGAAPVWYDADNPLASIEAAAAARYNDWKLTPPELSDSATQFAHNFTSRAAAVAPMTARGAPGVLLAEGESAARTGGAVATNNVQAYEVGSFKALQERSVVGDKLDLHHVGQAHAMEQVVPGYSRQTGPTIALPQWEHAAIPTLRGPVGLSPRSLLARDIWNLRQNTNAPNSALQQLIQMNKEMYPGAFGR